MGVQGKAGTTAGREKSAGLVEAGQHYAQPMTIEEQNEATTPAATKPAEGMADNPYFSALIAIYGLGFVLALIMLWIGGANAASWATDHLNPNTAFGTYDNGVGELVTGGIFGAIAAIALIVQIGVAAILHQLNRQQS